MPSLETPPNSAPPTQPVKVRTGRYGELEEHELVHLLDTLDDERSKARFRESVYISIFVYLAIAWFLFYGPRVLFHQPKLINPVDVLKEHDRITYLDAPKDLSKLAPRATPKARPTPRTLDQKTIKQLQAMRKAAPTPAPPAPAPAATPPPPTQQATPQPAPPLPLPQQPHPQQPTQLADAPRPAPTRPNFGSPQSAGDAIRQAAQNAAHDSGAGNYGNAPSSGRNAGMGAGVEVLSDMQGVDFDPYLRRILADIKRNWIPLIPEEARPPLNKEGETLIRFSILPDGRIGGMSLDDSTHDDAINRACWGAITSEGQFPPLPSNFHGPNLELRISFFTNKTPPSGAR